MSTMSRNKGSGLPMHQPQFVPRRNPNEGLSQQFQLSGYMMIASCVFWMLMLYLGIKGFQYGMMYRSFDDDKLEAVGCCVTSLAVSIEQENLKLIDGYNKGEAGPYLMRLGPESFSSNFKGTQSPRELLDIPTIVTAVSSADFYPVQSLIRQWKEELKPVYKDAKFIIYDIGLYPRELELIKTHCDCEVREFRSSIYPKHVADISTFAYRPIIIQTIVEEFGSVLWTNPDMLFTQASDLKQLMYRGTRDFFFWQPKEFIGTIAYTDAKMFQYLGESRCCFLETGMIDMGTLVIYRTNASWINIMKPWLKCALNHDCIAPPKSRYSGCFEVRSPKTTGCHRYDQSALSIIMDRMYQFSSKSEKYVTPRLSRQQEEHLEYFPEQPWTYTEIYFVCALPVTCVVILGYMYWRRRKVASAKANYRKR